MLDEMSATSRGRERNGNGNSGSRREGGMEEGGRLYSPHPPNQLLAYEDILILGYDRPPGAARLRVENLHYELGQEDLIVGLSKFPSQYLLLGI